MLKNKFFRPKTLKQALDNTAIIFLFISLISIAFITYQAATIFNLYTQNSVIDRFVIDISNASVHSNQLLTALTLAKESKYQRLTSIVVVPLSSLQEDKQHIQQDLQALKEENVPTELQEDAKNVLSTISTLTAISHDIVKMSRGPNTTPASLNARFKLLRVRHSQLETTLKVALSHSMQTQQQVQAKLNKEIRKLIRFAILVIVIWLAITWFSYYNISRQVFTPLKEFTLAVIQRATGKTQAPVPIKSENEIGELARAFNQLLASVQEARAKLHTLVEERTKALQKRTAQLQTATEVSRAVATERDINRLLPLAARLIGQRYGYYHIGIFLTTPNKEAAEITAVYNQDPETAEKILKKKLRIPAGVGGLVGRAIASGRVQIAQTIPKATKAAYQHILPETESAVAIPIRTGAEMLGIIDVQCKRPEAFAPEDITALQTIADQLAVALQNLRLLQETQQALKAARRAYAQASREGWKAYLARRRVYGYRLLQDGNLQPTTSEDSTTSPSFSEKSRGVSNAENILNLPIIVRGTTIAKAKLAKATPWSEGEKRLLAQLSERLGLALEGARLYAESQHRAAQLQIAAEVAREVNKVLELERLLTQAVNLVRERFGFYHASIFLLDETGHYMEVRASTGKAGEQLLARHHRLAIGSASIVGQTAARGEPVVVNDVSTSDIHHFNPLLPNTRSEMGIPLRAGDEIIGVLDIQAEVTNAFTEDDVHILQIMTDQLTVAVLNAQLFAETQRHIEQHRVLHKITTAAASAISMDDAINNALELLTEIKKGNRAIFLAPAPHDAQRLIVKAAAGLDEQTKQTIQSLSIALGEGTIGRVAVTEEPFMLNNLAEQNEKGITPDALSMAVLPLIYRGRLMGILDLESPRPNAFSEAEKELLMTLANSLAAILANIALLEQVRSRSEELEILYDITAAASSEVDLETLIQTLATKIREKLDILHCGVILTEGEGGMGVLAASSSAAGAPGVGQVGLHIPLHKIPLFREAITTRKPVVCRDIESDNRVGDMIDILRLRGAKQVIVVPLIAREEVIGILGLDIEEADRQITENDLRLLEQIAHQISTSVEVARLFSQAVRTAEREHLLAEITAKLRATNDPTVIIQTAVEEMRRALKAQTAQLLITDPDEIEGQQE